MRLAASPTNLPQTHAQQLDTVVVDSPLPGGAAEVVRFLLNTVPTWVQIGGVIVAGIVAAVVVATLFRQRRTIFAWFTTRNRAAKIALAAVAALLVVGVASVGAATWNFTQHDNAFCTGCHVMNPAFKEFASAENKHAELSCHACHQQPLSASVRQLYLWVAERPERIGEHARVENRVCETCHVTGDTATWQRIAATAGHRVHLESDSVALDNLQCVTCHGVEIHRFRPVSATCGQSGCHSTEDTDIVLGRMATQTASHCASCHGFTADVPALATRDSARMTLVPGGLQCMGCHEMRSVLTDFDAARDPHGGKCGSCHNPHTQKTPAEAITTCATAGCHADWRNEPFHVGPSHRRVGEQCLTCHAAHQAKVDASDCRACHESVRARGMFRAPLPFDTSAALRRGDAGAAQRAPRAPVARPHVTVATSYRSGSFGSDFGDDVTSFTPEHATPKKDAFHAGFAPAAVADTFSHTRHERIACLVCHQTGQGHGRLTFEPPRGCAICHHQAPAQARCHACHRTEEYGRPMPMSLTVTVSGHPPRPRSVDFVHAQHAAQRCIECHTTPVTLALAPAKAQCRDCHIEHHAVDRSCSSCHRVAEPQLAHTTPEIAHQRCDACHTRTTIERLTPTRSFCSTCHLEMRTSHYEPRECTVCHFLAEPDAYQPQLITQSQR